MDSGNCLREPYSGRPVSVISGEWKEILGVPQDRIRLIPYETVTGRAEKMMEIVTIPSMILEQDSVKEFSSAVIGFGNPDIFRGKSYGMILHSDYTI